MFRISSALALCALGLFTSVGRAQTTPAVSTILALSQSSPVGNLVKGADGALYGTSATSSSLTGGLIYRSTVDGSDVRTLYQLTADDAVSPGSGLTLAGAGTRADVDVEGFREALGLLMARYQGLSLKDMQMGPILQ